MSNERNWCLLLRRLFLIGFRLFFVLLFYFFANISFVTNTPDKFQFENQVRLSEINVRVPIRLKFKLYVVFIKWGTMIDFLFKGRRDIVNYWDFPSKISGNCHKMLVPKITRHDWWKVVVKMSLRDQLVCFADFLGMTLLAILFLLPLPNCFLRVGLPTPFVAVLKFFLPLTTSAVSGAANSIKWAPTRFAPGRTYLLFAEKGNCCSPNNLCKTTESSSALSTNTSIVWNLYLSWSNHLVTWFWFKMKIGSFSKLEKKLNSTHRYKGYFSPLVFLKFLWILWKDFLSSGLYCRLLNVWYFMYCMVVELTQNFSLEINGKQSSNGDFVLPTIL